MESGHRSYAADHLERAAQASIDLDPADRRVPDRAVDALIMAGDRARRRMESLSAVEYYERALAMAIIRNDSADRKSTRLNSSHSLLSRMPSSA